jgi:hypothetical protein
LLQTLSVHWLPVLGQVFAAPGWQVPFWHVSPTVQRLPSSHSVPFVTAVQVPLSGSQT